VVETTEPPPLPAPKRGKITVQVVGNGTVFTKRRRLLAAGAPVQQISCGMKGLSCYAEAPVGQQVTMGAQASPGYEFVGWKGSCSGSGPTCTVSAKAVESVDAVFVPKRGTTPVRVRLRQARVKASWKVSVGKGTLLVRGAISRKAKLKVELRRPGGGPLLVRRRRVHGGGFRFKAALRKGKLLRGAKLFPGPFVIAVRGSSQGSGVPLQVRTLRLAGPKAGVVRSTFVSTTRNGKAVKRIPAGSTEAWVTFRLAAQPRVGPIVVHWYQPGGALLGTKEKSNRPKIKTGIGGVAIPAGKWRVDLTAGGRLISRRNVVVR
jgi:hypothetical protein